MGDEFIHWDDVNLDDELGENNWTDGEEGEIWGDNESEWDIDGTEDESISVPEEKTSDETPPSINTKASTNKTGGTQYKCPLCTKQYKSTSGFRGHVLKKHNRSDLKGMFYNKLIILEDSHFDLSALILTQLVIACSYSLRFVKLFN